MVTTRSDRLHANRKGKETTYYHDFEKTNLVHKYNNKHQTQITKTVILQLQIIKTISKQTT